MFIEGLGKASANLLLNTGPYYIYLVFDYIEKTLEDEFNEKLEKKE